MRPCTARTWQGSPDTTGRGAVKDMAPPGGGWSVDTVGDRGPVTAATPRLSPLRAVRVNPVGGIPPQGVGKVVSAECARGQVALAVLHGSHDPGRDRRRVQ